MLVDQRYVCVGGISIPKMLSGAMATKTARNSPAIITVMAAPMLPTRPGFNVAINVAEAMKNRMARDTAVIIGPLARKRMRTSTINTTMPTSSIIAE